jgi:hypothetical protein
MIGDPQDQSGRAGALEGQNDPFFDGWAKLQHREPGAEQSEKRDDDPGAVRQQEDRQQDGTTKLGQGDDRKIGGAGAAGRRGDAYGDAHRFRPSP